MFKLQLVKIYICKFNTVETMDSLKKFGLNEGSLENEILPKLKESFLLNVHIIELFK